MEQFGFGYGDTRSNNAAAIAAAAAGAVDDDYDYDDVDYEAAYGEDGYGYGVDSDDEDTNESFVDFDYETLGQLQSSQLYLFGLTSFSRSGLSVNPANFWIKGAGPLIGKSVLLRLKLILNPCNHCLDELFTGLAGNKSVGRFDLKIQRDGHGDIFDRLRPFFHHSNIGDLSVSTNIDSPPALTSLASALEACDRLERIMIDWNQAAKDEEVAAVFVSLINKPMMAIIVKRNPLGQKSCSAMANLLSIPSSQIVLLEFKHCAFDTESLDILCDAIIKNNTVKQLCLVDIGPITTSGCMSLAKVLSHPMSSLEMLLVCKNNITDEGIAYLGKGVAGNSTVKHLAISDHQSITLTGWQAFSNFMAAPGSAPALDEILLQNCNLNDEKAAVIFSALTTNTSLKTLTIDDNPRMTVRGLYSFFHSLLGSRSAIEELYMPFTIGFEKVNDEEFDAEFGILCRALCDTTSIGSTYASNHSFINCQLFAKLGDGDIGSLWEKIQSLTEGMNMNPNKAEVARKKIMKYHFSAGTSGINELACMQETILPHALGWVGREKDGFSPMFRFVQGSPALFGTTRVQAVGTKRMKV